MSLSLNNEMNIEVKARFIAKGHEGPLTGDAYLVRLYDKDIFNDDFLGETTPDANGVVKFNITLESFGDLLNIDDKPDFYIVVLKHQNEIFRSVVMKDINLELVETFKMGEGEVLDLGTFLVQG